MAQVNNQYVRYAGFRERAAAFILDTIIVLTLLFYLMDGVFYTGNFLGPFLFAGSATVFGVKEMPAILGNIVAGSVFLLLLCWLYSAGMTSSVYGATFGKVIMGLKVTDVMGDRLSFLHATVRFIAKIFSGLILFIGFFMIHYSETKQGLHDRFAGTYVVYGKTVLPAPPDAGPAIAPVGSEEDEK